MRLIVFCIGFCANAICAAAANQLSWVASFGIDNAACGTRAAPCRTFQGAIANTIVGGIVKAIDAAEYSMNGASLIIQSPITIDGADAGAALTTTNIAIEVLGAPAGTDPGMVTIRNLTINADSGIQMFRPVHVENVTVTGGTYGMSAGKNGVLTAENVTIAGASSVGLMIAGGTAVLRNSTIHGSTLGIDVYHATAMIDHSDISFNGQAIFVDGVSMARIGNSVVTGNNVGLAKARGGQLFSFGNNMIAGNKEDGSADLIPLK